MEEGDSNHIQAVGSKTQFPAVHCGGQAVHGASPLGRMCRVTQIAGGGFPPEAPTSNAQGVHPRCLSVTQKPGWLVQLCLLAPTYDFFLS